MSDLVLTNKIQIFREDFKCKKCLVFQMLNNLSRRWFVTENGLEEIKLSISEDCYFLKRFLGSVHLTNFDYNMLEKCDKLIPSNNWAGIEKKDIAFLEKLTDFIFLVTFKEFEMLDLFKLLVDNGIDLKRIRSCEDSLDRLDFEASSRNIAYEELLNLWRIVDGC